MLLARTLQRRAGARATRSFAGIEKTLDGKRSMRCRDSDVIERIIRRADGVAVGESLTHNAIDATQVRRRRSAS